MTLGTDFEIKLLVSRKYFLMFLILILYESEQNQVTNFI